MAVVQKTKSNRASQSAQPNAARYAYRFPSKWLHAVAQKARCKRIRVIMGEKSPCNLCERGQDAGQEVPMRTPKRLYPAERLIYHPELLTCPHCGDLLVMWNSLSCSLPLLACHERQPRDRLAQVAKAQGGVIIALDGLAPQGGAPQSWGMR